MVGGGGMQSNTATSHCFNDLVNIQGVFFPCGFSVLKLCLIMKKANLKNCLHVSILKILLLVYLFSTIVSCD